MRHQLNRILLTHLNDFQGEQQPEHLRTMPTDRNEELSQDLTKLVRGASDNKAGHKWLLSPKDRHRNGATIA